MNLEDLKSYVNKYLLEKLLKIFVVISLTTVLVKLVMLLGTLKFNAVPNYSKAESKEINGKIARCY